MGFDEMMRELAQRANGENDRPPVTTADFAEYLGYFDDRIFKVGEWVQKRYDSKDRNEGGIVNYTWPKRGEPALVVKVLDHSKPDSSGGYEDERLILLVFDSNHRPTRVAVDPVHFERYETQGERILREIEAESSS